MQRGWKRKREVVFADECAPSQFDRLTDEALENVVRHMSGKPRSWNWESFVGDSRKSAADRRPRHPGNSRTLSRAQVDCSYPDRRKHWR